MSKDGVTAVGVSPMSAKPSLGSRVAAHFKRWWWVHVIIFIAVVLVIALPVVYVGYPNIAQDDINESTLKITSMAITDPATDAFTLKQTQVIGTDSIFHPTIFAFDAAVSLLGSAAFAKVRVPEIKANDGTKMDIDQRLDLSDVDAFTDFSKAVMLEKEVKLNVYGVPDLKQGALPTIDVTYNKTVTMKGLNKLEGFKLSKMHLAKGPNGANLKGNVFIPNPSVMTITMGNVTLDLSVDGKPIGQSFLNELVLKPGDNNLDMFANTELVTVTKLLPKYKNNIIPVDITGNTTTYNGQELPYFAAALAANKLQVDLDVGEILKGVK